MIRYGAEEKREVSKTLAASLPCTSEVAIHRGRKHPGKNSFGLMVKGKTLLAFALLHSVLQGQICLLLRCFLTSYFCIPVPYHEKDIFFGVLVLKGLLGLHRTVQLQLLQHYWLGHRLKSTVILNDLPWKQTEIILSFLRLHPSTAFQTLLLTMMATSFLLRDSCPQ